jgi:hypothetical protein
MRKNNQINTEFNLELNTEFNLELKSILIIKIIIKFYNN